MGGQSVEPIHPSCGREEMEGMMMMAILLPSARGRLRRLRGDLVVCCWRLSLERPTTGE